ncbi:DUF3077 domain-containing protein [Pseudomonas cremoricolorata]|uniref:DUF3077 domain-containing protein n=1 Tax=Pseudomonas cremoricolorata TaxID=157783 RepID=UPI000428589A|nr:DUF3077 domain-containing protein [Pseudomonas cremoricolorata]
MTTEYATECTVGQTAFCQGENHTNPLFRIEPGIPCRHAREQASELLDYARYLTIEGLMEDKPKMIWASHYLCAMAKALLDDAELGMGV